MDERIITIEITPQVVKDTIYSQIGYFKEREFRDPNCVIFGIRIIQMLDAAGMLHRDEHTQECYFENLKIYLDGDNEINIAVAYNIFIQTKIIV